MKKSVKKYLILSFLFFSPIFIYIFFASGINNFARLPILTTNVLDIQSINGNKIKAFCHLREAIRLFDLDRIKKVEISGKMANWQDSLL
mgnify:CR=1 FL=1